MLADKGLHSLIAIREFTKEVLPLISKCGKFKLTQTPANSVSIHDSRISLVHREYH